MTDKPAKSKAGKIANAGDLSPNQLLTKAVEGNADVEVMERLMALQERYEENRAKKAFDRAMSDLRSDLPKIVKNKQVDHKGAKYQYEDLSDVTEALAPAMAEHGLSFRWQTETHTDTKPTTIEVSCIVSHEDGHYEETTLEAPVDTSGSKNPIQGVGSAVTYLQRYTLKAAVGVAAAPDDDAQSVGGGGGASNSRRKKKNTDKPTAPCPKHEGKTLVKRSNKKGTWWSHKKEDGSWCNAEPADEHRSDKSDDADEKSDVSGNKDGNGERPNPSSDTDTAGNEGAGEDEDGLGDNGNNRPDWADEWLDRDLDTIKSAYDEGDVTADEVASRERQLPEDEQRSEVLDWASTEVDKQQADELNEPQPLG